MEFIVIELNLYLDTHPCDEDALHDYNCAVKMFEKYVKEYQERCAMMFAQGCCAKTDCWDWVEAPWPWEL